MTDASKRLPSWVRRIGSVAVAALLLGAIHTDVSAAVTRSERRVFAHYFPPYPVSLDNKQAGSGYYATHYLSPTGESGRHRAYGGLLRDRPSPRVARSNGSWRVQDLKDEVRDAKAHGIDGFTLNLMAAEGLNWRRSVDLMKAAHEVGDFEIVPNVDATSSFVKLSASTAADRLAVLLAMPAAARDRGQLMLSSFAAERAPTAWWCAVLARLATRHRMPVSFTAVFLNASDHNLDAFAPFSSGFGNWGTRATKTVEAAPNHSARAHRLGKTWMAPVAFQDARPAAGAYAEAGNTDLARAMWFKSMRDGADYVQIVTWNDYGESTHIADSAAHGDAFLEVTERYATWFKDEQRPEVSEDKVVVTHRIAPHSARAQVSSKPMVPLLGGERSTPRDTVEALFFLTAPATVSVQSGGVTRTDTFGAGVFGLTVPLSAGRPSVTVRRDGRTVIDARSPHAVTNSPRVTDLQYWAFTARPGS